MVSIINKPRTVTRKATTAMEHILTNSFVDRSFETVIFRRNIWDLFPISFVKPSTKSKTKSKTSFILIRICKAKSINAFKQQLHETNWS